jgi:hypothetical protein
MDKYAVELDGSPEKTKTGAAGASCPQCGTTIRTPQYCDKCGTEPWEKRPTAPPSKK